MDWTMLAGKQKLQPRADRTEEEKAALKAFNKVTEVASALMDSGELDVYSTSREEFMRAAALFVPEADIFADDDAADDMFADDAQDSKVLRSLTVLGHIANSHRAFLHADMNLYSV
jgi:hypothetical protein